MMLYLHDLQSMGVLGDVLYILVSSVVSDRLFCVCVWCGFVLREREKERERERGGGGRGGGRGRDRDRDRRNKDRRRERGREREREGEGDRVSMLS